MGWIVRLASVAMTCATILAACSPSNGAKYLAGDSHLLIPQDHPAVAWLNDSTLFFEGSPEDVA
jgi:hypothetical protein